MVRPNPAARIVIAERRIKAIAMKNRGHTLQDIATALGYKTTGAVAQDITRALEVTRGELALNAEQLREQSLQRLDEMRRKVWEVLERRHVLVSGGTVVRDWPLGEDGEPDYLGQMPEPLIDDGPALAAVDRLVRIEQRMAALLGIDAPQRVETTGTINYVIEGVDLSKLQ